MKQIILILALTTMPFLSFSQSDNEHALESINVEVIKDVLKQDTELSLRKVEPISDNPKIQNKVINFNKSNDLISIKAYMKSLQMKRKETLMS